MERVSEASGEIVPVWDEDGRPCGTASRAEVRARNLRHAANSVVVRDRMGRVFVHRRTDTKDVFPGLFDFGAGGVMTIGEEPLAAAVREVEEELGVSGVALRLLGQADYADEHTRYHAFLYETEYDGPVRLQPEEVAWGEWVTLERLDRMLAEVDFVPDTKALLGPWLKGRLREREPFGDGWDNVTELVEGRWVDRTPRRPATVAPLLRETRLLPRIAPLLPIPVPEPVVLEDDPLRVRHRLVPGSSVPPATLPAAAGEAVGRFLRALHRLPTADLGLPGEDVVRADRLGWLDRFSVDVVPRLPATARPAASELLGALRDAPTGTLVHGDLGPEHLLLDDGQVSGIIDWGDTQLGDPAIDLAWTAHGTPDEFRDALVAAYSPTADELARARRWHQLGPWFEVPYGLDEGLPNYVESGLAGVLERL